MTNREDYTQQEWRSIIKLGEEVALLIKAASPGGALQEALAIGKAVADAQKEFEQSELIQAVIQETGTGQVGASAGAQHGGGFESQKAAALDRCREVMGILGQKATAQEVEDYRRYIATIADRVAGAASEGGVFGFGGQRVTTEERETLDALVAALNAPKAPPPATLAAPSTPVAPAEVFSGTLAGTVTYREMIVLEPQALVTVRLLDRSLPLLLAPVIAEEKVQAGGRQVPLPFVLTYDPDAIHPERPYAVQASITVDSRVRFLSSGGDRVITQGSPNEVEIVVRVVE